MMGQGKPANISNNHAFVSVIMPCYNSAEFIEISVDSILQQTYKNFELIIIDDGSTDDTLNILKRLAESDDRICIICNESNIGAAKSRNKGLDLCKGDYVAFIDSDDIWRKDKLDRQIALSLAMKADIVYCSYAIINENGEKQCNDFIIPEATTYKDTLIRSVISSSTVLLSREIADKYRFPTDFYHEDLALWLMLLKDGYKAVGVTDVLSDYRIRSDSRSSNKLSSAKNRFNIYRNFLHLSLPYSIWNITRYGILAVIKYRKI